MVEPHGFGHRRKGIAACLWEHVGGHSARKRLLPQSKHTVPSMVMNDHVLRALYYRLDSLSSDCLLPIRVK